MNKKTLNILDCDFVNQIALAIPVIEYNHMMTEGGLSDKYKAQVYSELQQYGITESIDSRLIEEFFRSLVQQAFHTASALINDMNSNSKYFINMSTRKFFDTIIEGYYQQHYKSYDYEYTPRSEIYKSFFDEKGDRKINTN